MTFLFTKVLRRLPIEPPANDQTFTREIAMAANAVHDAAGESRMGHAIGQCLFNLVFLANRGDAGSFERIAKAIFDEEQRALSAIGSR